MITYLKKIWKEYVEKRDLKRYLKNHKVCEFKCVGWCSHFNQVGEIKESIKNPSWHHYPSAEVKRGWLAKGFDYARVMQSQWECKCGKHQTFFFLAKPSKGYGGRIEQPDTIPTTVYEEMTKHNPFTLGSSRGTTIGELTDSLIKEFCR
jgi:hypothetical protein